MKHMACISVQCFEGKCFQFLYKIQQTLLLNLTLLDSRGQQCPSYNRQCHMHVDETDLGQPNGLSLNLG